MRKVGILGSGGMGRTHARQYRLFPDVELLFYDRDPERSKQFASEYQAQPCSSPEELIEKSDVIDICLPTHLHHSYAERALRAGKPVLCEKPMARTVKECEQLVELSHKLEIPLMPAQVVRFFPEFRKAREFIQGGRIGEPAVARTHRGGNYPQGSDDWFGKFEYSGGVLLDLCIHDFDWLRWTFGDVDSVFSQALTFSGIPRKDYALTTVRMVSGVLAHVEGTWADPAGFRTAFEVCGSEGFIEFDSRETATLRLSMPGSSTLESPLFPHDDPYYCEIKAFLNALKDGTPLPVSPEDGLIAVAIAETAIESARTGKPMKVPRF
jgi:UDP-N-acetylglucosamine 3-dehydrogenase